MKRSLFTGLIIAISVFGISACGGGGGAEEPRQAIPATPTPTPPPAPLTVRAIQDVVYLNEGATESITLSVLGAVNGFTVSYTKTGDPGVELDVAQSNAGMVLKLSADNIYIDSKASFNIVVTDGNARTQDVDFSVEVYNASVDALLLRVSDVSTAGFNFQESAESIKLIQFLAELEEVVTLKLPAAPLREDLTSDDAQTALGTLSDKFYADYQAYKDSAQNNTGDPISEEVMIASAQAIFDWTQTLAPPQVDFLTQRMSSALGDYTLPIGEVYYVEQTKTLSLFIGNPRLGAWSGEEWVFNSEYGFLNDVLLQGAQ